MNTGLLALMSLFILTTGHSICYAQGDKANRLINEKSPYLLQHAYNPVNWYPWSDEAFEKAKKEDKPIFLSIGYSTCHWCHVMEDESFSNQEIANILNQHFVAIKVDREERPDIDNYYMKAVMTMIGQGGWPLNVFITPEKKPFFGGTYFPPENKFGLRGLGSILISVHQAWEQEREALLSSSDRLQAAINKRSAVTDTSQFSIDQLIIKKAAAELISNFDKNYGGSKGSPKFPIPHNYTFLLHYWLNTADQEAKNMVMYTLSQMAKGGIYDQLEGGFHRYSTDEQWRVPHFEKMLYDQALISRLFTEAYLIDNNEAFKHTAKQTIDFVLKRFQSPEGGFFSAFDADSLNFQGIKEEGAFYVWTYEEINKALGKKDALVFCAYYGITEQGNAISDPHNMFRKKNVLYRAQTLEQTAIMFKLKLEQVEAILSQSRGKLIDLRLKRALPHCDDKVIVDWNSLMISSLAFASRVFDQPEYYNSAKKSADFVLDNMLDKNYRLMHRYRDNQTAIFGMIDDYVFFVQAMLDLYEAGFELKYLKAAIAINKVMLEDFWDKENNGLFFSSQNFNSVFPGQKEVYDGALPSGNAIAALNFIRLAKITKDSLLLEKAEDIFKVFYAQIEKMPSAFCQMMIAANMFDGGVKEIVIVGDSAESKELINTVFLRFLPNKSVVLKPPEKKLANQIVAVLPYLKDQISIENKPTVYICENFTCQAPIISKEVLQKILGK
ncbi:MAG: thioredoxin domain-containing protein [Candidatus Omnitrophica bacterium]|nr:thioredoxin domain-containing protein [Candidatus Omnitrophota bacterium]